VLERIPPGNYRRICDAGCGSGRLTAHLLRRFPGSAVVGLDRSPAMLDQAARTLRRFRGRLTLVEGDLLAADPGGPFDLIFSNAAFHWVGDHARLFRRLHDWLAPGGLLFAQCGGRGNIREAERLTRRVGERGEFRPHFRGFRRPVRYAGAGPTRRLLAQAGFREIRAWLEPAPTRFGSRAAFRDFMAGVVLVPNLSRLPDAGLRARYVAAFLSAYEAAFGRRYRLDYVRLNLTARR
jgi:trans-aconitate 2-methyltransferase